MGLHFPTHSGTELICKPECNETLGMPEYKQVVEINGFDYLNHILVFHITDKEHLHAVIKGRMKWTGKWVFWQNVEMFGEFLAVICTAVSILEAIASLGIQLLNEPVIGSEPFQSLKYKRKS